MAGALYWSRSLRQLLTDAVGSSTSSSLTSLNLYFWPLTVIPPAALISLTAISIPFRRPGRIPRPLRSWDRCTRPPLLSPPAPKLPPAGQTDARATAKNNSIDTENPLQVFIVMPSSFSSRFDLRHRISIGSDDAAKYSGWRRRAEVHRDGERRQPKKIKAHRFS